MSARKSARVREWAPEWADPGTALVWTDHDDASLWGTVWCAGPKNGTRWCTLSDGSVALVKVGMSGRHAGQVYQEARHEPGWQRRVIRALDLLHNSTVWTSTHAVPYSVCELAHATYQRTTVHVDRDCCAELDESRWRSSGEGGTEYVRALLRSGTDRYGNEIDGHRKIEDTMGQLCPKCIGDLAGSVAA